MLYAHSSSAPAGAIFGPILTKWLQLLNRLQFASPTKSVVYKVYLDQFVFTPGAHQVLVSAAIDAC